MNWEKLWAQRTEGMKRSAVRELLKVVRQPGMISFAGGLPAPELFPIEEMRTAADLVLSRDGTTALQYGESEGLPELRAWIGEQHGCAAENVLIVSGSQQGLDLIGRVFLNEGDVVVTANPTYLAMLSAWRPWRPSFAVAHADPKLTYCVPNFSNPDGLTLSLAEREQLVRSDHVIVEDDPYRELRFDGAPLPRMLELRRPNVIYLGSFSKMLAPGLRIGWVIGPTEVIGKLAQARQAMDLQTSTFNQRIVLEVVSQGLLERHIPRLCAAYRERRDVMLRALEQWFPKAATWSRPAGGMFLMVRLPEGFDATALLQAALREKVAFVPGEEFFFDGSGRNTMRLNFSNATLEVIDTGIHRLGTLVAKALV